MASGPDAAGREEGGAAKEVGFGHCYRRASRAGSKGSLEEDAEV